VTPSLGRLLTKAKDPNDLDTVTIPPDAILVFTSAVGLLIGVFLLLGWLSPRAKDPTLAKEKKEKENEKFSFQHVGVGGFPRGLSNGARAYRSALFTGVFSFILIVLLNHFKRLLQDISS